MATSGGGAAGARVYDQIIDTLNAIFGRHPGYRPIHAKGIVCEGSFQASGRARELTRAPHMQGQTVPVLVRFSDFSGVPTVADADPMASPRGMAIRFQLQDGSSTDIVAHSYNGFPARDAEEFLAFVQAVASSGAEAKEPSTLQTFLSAHPAARRFVEDPKPAPRSFATGSFYPVDTFRFTNRDRRIQYGRYRIVPGAGEQHLDASEAARRPANFLFDELAERLSRNAAEFRLMLQLAAEDDVIDDPTIAWPEDRPLVELGKLQVTKQAANFDEIQRTTVFDPARLVDGIEPGDPLVEVRSAVYAISLRRRQA